MTVTGTVVSINPSQTNTDVGFYTVVGFTDGTIHFVLDYAHPGYSAIYTLLIASGANKKSISLDVVPDAVGDMVPNAAIQGVEFQF